MNVSHLAPSREFSFLYFASNKVNVSFTRASFYCACAGSSSVAVAFLNDVFLFACESSQVREYLREIVVCHASGSAGRDNISNILRS